LYFEEDMCYLHIWVVVIVMLCLWLKFFQGLESGEITLAIGTHSLISESVKFANLGLAVVDEQHRFGVAQRGRLNSKVKLMFPDSSSRFLGFCALCNQAIYSELFF